MIEIPFSTTNYSFYHKKKEKRRKTDYDGIFGSEIGLGKPDSACLGPHEMQFGLT